MKCLVCQKNEAIRDPSYGIIPCGDCQAKQRTKISKQVEFTTSDIKEQRKIHADDIIQPFNKGHLSKEYVEKYGTKGIVVSEDEVKKAKDVWRDERYYN